MTSRETDQQLVERAQRGDTRAFDLLVLKYQGRIAALISRFVGNPSEIEDVTQEAFIKAFRALPKFRGDSAFYTWLYRIAANAAKNHLVAKGRRPSSDADIEDAEFYEDGGALHDTENPENSLFGDELAKVVSDALNSLPAELKRALTLREFEGLSYEEIAEVMDCPVGTVRSRIFRARDAIDSKVRVQMSGELE
ncbi:RNA polymerase sigma factor RpoE [Luminiphilus syltensis NOR5-1B]|uniref:RNA polymerase sigma factor n=1 Tax=Luminiphilus syltensis NOR5-1B TaxID=565045 RepID=B8KRG0_9GAMM|nr:RNA polymerase sigma factor RpoE [Luminiphilus syltensis]EED34125.1 RNA polymerase sigma factor RpoE [Luminiphilus syltensis NOR5-1B]